MPKFEPVEHSLAIFFRTRHASRKYTKYVLGSWGRRRWVIEWERLVVRRGPEPEARSRRLVELGSRVVDFSEGELHVRLPGAQEYLFNKVMI